MLCVLTTPLRGFFTNKACALRCQKVILALCLLLSGFSSTSQADHQVLGSSLTLAASPTMPPYVIADNNRGIAIDLLRAVLALENKALTIEYGDNRSNIQALNQGHADINFIANPTLTPNAHFADEPLLEFENVAVSLVRSNIQLDQISTMGSYRIGAFPLAHKLLNDAFQQASQQSPDYREYSSQKQQVRDLFNGSRDIIIIDRTIFRYFLSQLRRQSPSDPVYHQQYNYHQLFAPRKYYSAFHSIEAKQLFDHGFATIKNNGDYDRIVGFYRSLLADYLFE